MSPWRPNILGVYAQMPHGLPRFLKIAVCLPWCLQHAVFVRQSMDTDQMSFVLHTLDECRILFGKLCHDKKACFDIIPCEQLQQLRCI